MSEASRPDRVVLVGFMGSGKTTVGRKLARRLGWTFVDLDQAIEERAGATVPELFERRGEPAFRQLEAEAAEALTGGHELVLAAGGGAFESERTRAALRAGRTLTVWLRCDLDTALRRIGSGSGRPLAGSRETMRALLDRRVGTYALADRVEDTTSLSPSEVARRLAVAVGARRDPGAGGTCGT